MITLECEDRLMRITRSNRQVLEQSYRRTIRNNDLLRRGRTKNPYRRHLKRHGNVEEARVIADKELGTLDQPRRLPNCRPPDSIDEPEVGQWQERSDDLVL